MLYSYGSWLGSAEESVEKELPADVEEAVEEATAVAGAPTVVVIVQGGGGDGSTSKAEVAETPWYKEPAFVGGVVGVVVLTVLGLYMRKAEKIAGAD
jgi:hypothetical protein